MNYITDTPSTIAVKVPKSGKYTLYAEGNLLGMNDQGPYFKLNFDFESPVCLWYTHTQHRRVYIIMKPTLYKMESADVIGDFSILSQLRGRSFDRFKRSLKYICRITKCACYTFPPAFYYSLSNLAAVGKNSRANLILLTHRYYKK